MRRRKDLGNAGSFPKDGRKGSLSLVLLHRLLDRLVGVACGGRIHLADLRHLGHPVLVRILRVIGLDLKGLVERLDGDELLPCARRILERPPLAELS